MKKSALIASLALALTFWAATVALPFELTIYNEIECFHWPNIPQRLCNQWSIKARADGGFSLECLITGIDMTKELMAQKAEYTKADKKKLVAALEKGLKWAKAAQARKIDIIKRIDVIGGNLEVDFLSTAEGRECVIRFKLEKLFRDGPIYMFTPYVHNKTTAHSIKAMTAALKASDKLYKKAAQENKKQYEIFK